MAMYDTLCPFYPVTLGKKNEIRLAWRFMEIPSFVSATSDIADLCTPRYLVNGFNSRCDFFHKQPTDVKNTLLYKTATERFSRYANPNVDRVPRHTNNFQYLKITVTLNIKIST